MNTVSYQLTCPYCAGPLHHQHTGQQQPSRAVDLLHCDTCQRTWAYLRQLALVHRGDRRRNPRPHHNQKGRP